ncbi:hypothetical protein FACS1894185_4830 [Betaproteobacteria bacterium]|nr:hypothetical protein FACS1894185_4830 [Betaproteobacteria bacterium]
MPHDIGFVDNSSTLAHYAMLEKIKDFASANGWQILRYDDTVDNRELILKSAGYSGGEEIFIGLRTYQNADADYYNLIAGAFTGFVPGNSFDTQPGAALSGVPAHNQRIDYWLTINGQRLAGALKVGTPVYESFYIGKFFPYARPNQYPYPVICAGMLNGTPATRFSDTAHSMPWKGSRANLLMRFVDGAWRQPATYPWNNAYLAGVLAPGGQESSVAQLRDTGDNYPLIPVELMDTGGVYGYLDGIFHIAGFNNVVENTLTLAGDDYVVIQDVSRTGFNDYFALKLDN